MMATEHDVRITIDWAESLERHASAVSDALKRIEILESRCDDLTVDCRPRPDPSVRAPRDRIRFRRTQDMPALICDLCRMTCVELVRIDDQFDLCDACIDKLERALGVGG